MAELTGRQRRLFERQGRLHAHVQPGKEFLWRTRYRRRPGARLAPASPLLINIKQRRPYLGRPISATVRPTRDRCYETFNMAALWSSAGAVHPGKQPAMPWAPPYRTGFGAPDGALQADRRDRIGIPGEQVDGMDVLADESGGRRRGGREVCRAGEGPYVLDGDENLPLPRSFDVRSGEVPHARGSLRDARRARPDRHARARLIALGAADEAELKEIDKEIRAIVADAATFARNDPEARACGTLQRCPGRRLTPRLRSGDRLCPSTSSCRPSRRP